MAELLGAIASGISVTTLAVQVGRSIVKLKDYWSQMNDAPYDMKIRLLQLDQLHYSLQCVQRGQAQNTIPDLPPASLELCREGADQLRQLVNELAQKIGSKSGWRQRKESIKMILKKDEMKRLENKLDKAIQLLQFSLHCQANAILQRNTAILELTHAMVQAQPSIIIAEISKTMTNNATMHHLDPKEGRQILSDRLVIKSSNSGSHLNMLHFVFGILQVQKQFRKNKSKIHEEICARYKLPAWFSNRVLDASAYYDNVSGLHFNIQACRVISSESEFLTKIRLGDLTGVQNMLANRTAFVTDRIESKKLVAFGTLTVYTHNATPLHIAAVEGNFEMCQLLLNEGADVLAVNDFDETPLHTLAHFAAFLTVEKEIDVMGLFHLLIRSGTIEAMVDDFSVLACFKGPKSSLQFLQQQAYPPYYDTPLEARFEVLLHYLGFYWRNIPELMKISFCHGPITPDVALFVGRDGCTFLHLISEFWVNSFLESSHHSEEHTSDIRQHPELYAEFRTDTPDEECRLLARETIMAGALVTATNTQRCTPFQNLMSNLFRNWFLLDPEHWPGDRSWHTALTCLISNWLADLDSCGVDLQDYGAKEWELHCDYEVDFEIIHDLHDPLNRPLREQHTRLISFTYGPRPEDWKLWFSEPTDEYAGDFWYMVEHRSDDYETDEEDDILSMHLPGAWFEEYQE